MGLDIVGFVSRFRETYDLEIKPLFDKGDYGTATFLLENHLSRLERDDGVLMDELHCGLGLLSNLQLFCRSLQENDFSEIGKKKRDFEAYLAQTKLPRSD